MKSIADITARTLLLGPILLVSAQGGFASNPIKQPVQTEMAVCEQLLGGNALPGVVHSMASLLGEALSHTEDLDHPYLDAGLNSDEIGKIQKRFQKVLPDYTRLVNLNQHTVLAKEEWAEVETISANLYDLLSRLKSHHGPLGSFKLSELGDLGLALLESSHAIRSLETKKPFDPATERHIAEKKEQPQSEKKKDGQDLDTCPCAGWNSPPPVYHPHNKRLSQQDKNQKAFELIRTNAKSGQHLFPQIYYDTVTSAGIASDPLAQGKKRSVDATTLEDRFLMIVSTYGESEITLPLPYGYVPLEKASSGTVVRSKATGEYKLVALDKSHSEKVEVTLVKDPGFSLQPNLMQYRQSSGIPASEWPEYVRTFIASLKKAHTADAKEIGTAIQDFLKNTMKYYSEGKESSNEDLDKADVRYAKAPSVYPAVKAAYAKYMNCDFAAVLGALWVRDFFSMPARVVGGLTLTSRQVDKERGIDFDVITDASSPHAWFEVWNGADWIPFDGTAVHTPLSDAGSKQAWHEGLKKESKSAPDQQTAESKPTKSEQPENRDGGKQDESHKEGTTSEAEQAKRLTQEAQLAERLLALLKKTPHSLADFLEQVLLLNYREHGLNEGWNRASEDVERWVRSLTPSTWQEAWSSTLQNEYMRIGATEALPSAARQLTDLKINAVEGRIEDVWKGLMQIQREILLLAELRRLSSHEEQFLGAIQRLLSQVAPLADADSQDIGRAKLLIKNLPGKLSRKILEEKVGGPLSLDDSPPLRKLAKALKQGELEYFEQLAGANAFSKLVLTHYSEPIYDDIPTYERDILAQSRRNIVIAKDLTEFPNFLWNLRPGEHPFAQFVEGTQFALGARKTNRVISPKKPLTRTFTVVLYDISPSMAGDKIKMVQLVLGAIRDRALSEQDSMGLPLHETIEIPFDTAVVLNKIQHFSTPHDAQVQLNVDSHAELAANGNGTDIQAAVEYFLRFVGDTYAKEKNNPKIKRKVARVNLVLLSDGGSSIDLAALKSIINSLPPEIQIYMNFIAVQESNASLEKLAESMRPLTAKHEGAVFRQLTTQDINSILNASLTRMSDAIEADPSVFTPRSGAQLSREMIAQVAELSQNIPNFITAPAQLSTTVSGVLPESRHVDTQDRQTPVWFQLAGFTNWLTRQTHLSSELRRRIVSALFQQFYSSSRNGSTYTADVERSTWEQLLLWGNGG